MSPALKALAERAIAAGAPEADDHTIIVVPGVSFRSVLTGLVYDRLTRLPLLSDPSWLGWVLDEVSRRGYAYAIEAVDGGMYRVNAWHSSWVCERYSLHMGREEALVTLLEATHTKSAP